MDDPSAGWYVDPDPVARTSYPVRWWDGERWGDQQAWHMAWDRGWVHHGTTSGRVYLFARQHPWVGGACVATSLKAPYLIVDPIFFGEFRPLALCSWLGLTLFFRFGFTRPGEKPAIGPPPPAASAPRPWRKRKALEA